MWVEEGVRRFVHFKSQLAFMKGSKTLIREARLSIWKGQGSRKIEIALE